MAKIIHTLNMAKQAALIKRLFPSSSVTFDKNKLIWKYALKPLSISDSYDVKLVYVRNQHPNVFVINQKLECHPDEKELPHVYNHSRQHLCLYYRKTRQWKSNMPIATTIIPWASEWLFHYELWLSSGDWYGGGIH